MSRFFDLIWRRDFVPRLRIGYFLRTKLTNRTGVPDHRHGYNRCKAAPHSSESCLDPVNFRPHFIKKGPRPYKDNNTNNHSEAQRNVLSIFDDHSD